MVDTRRLTQLVDTALDRLRLPRSRPVVALSGGADSAALAYLLGRIDVEVTAVHINHRLTHSDVMEKAAREIATELDIDIDVISVEVPEGPSPEGQARSARYEVLGGLADSDAVLTAHTLDDNAETMLINLIRGSGMGGLSGIPVHRPPNVFRPILGVSRAVTRELATLADLPYIDDPMNEDFTLTRNYIRHRLLPEIRPLNPNIAATLARTAERLGRDDEFLVGSAPGPELSEGVARIPIGALRTCPEPLASRTLKMMLTHVVGEGGVSAERLRRVHGVAIGAGRRQEVGSGAIARIDGPYLVLAIESSAPPTGPVALTPGVHRVSGMLLDVLRADEVCRVIPLSSWTALFPAGSRLEFSPDGVVTADGEPAWVPGRKRLAVAWYRPGSVGYLSVFARQETGWTSSL